MQNYEIKSQRIREQFDVLKADRPAALEKRLTLSWSVWMFGIERLEDSAKRLKRNGIDYIELKGDRQTAQSGIPTSEVKKVLSDYGMRVSGVCGMFLPTTIYPPLMCIRCKMRSIILPAYRRQQPGRPRHRHDRF